MAKNVPAGKEYTADTIKDDASKLGGPGRIADDVLQAACIVGTAIRDRQWTDFANVKGRSEFEGKEIGAGPASSVMGVARTEFVSLGGAEITFNQKHLSGWKRGRRSRSISATSQSVLPAAGEQPIEVRRLV